MCSLTDIQGLYGSVNSTWAKNRAHIIAHTLAAVVVFLICRAAIPEVELPKIDVKQIMSNQWYALAKDTGLIYVAIALPLFVCAVYVAILRTLGRILSFVAMLLLPPMFRDDPFTSFTAEALEPLALVLGKQDFFLHELIWKANEILEFYNLKNEESRDAYQNTLSNLKKNSQIYLGDFLVFMLGWVLLFKLAPQLVWVKASDRVFWPVVVLLALLVCFAWFRVSRALSAMPRLVLMYVTMRLASDPDFFPIPQVSAENRSKLKEKLERALPPNRKSTKGGPSLRRFVRHQLLGPTSANKYEKIRRRDGFPFYGLYARGLDFSWDSDLNENYDDQWVPGYLAFLYYRLHKGVRRSMQKFWLVIRFLLTGAP
jgi:hypothetical protein